jgi:hypothetical protein
MCLSKGKIKVELELTPDELVELGKFLKKKVATVVASSTGGEGNSGGGA